MPEASTTLPANDPRDSRSRLLVWAWWVVFGGLLLAILALAVYLALRKPETVYRTLPPPPPDAQQQSLLDQARTKGEALSAEIAALRAALVAYICPPGTVKDPTAPEIPIPPANGSGSLAPSGGQLGMEVTPTAVQQEASNATAAAASAAGTPAHRLGQHELVDLLTHAVVLVLTESSSASGFFIAPNYVVTNRHAVEAAKDGRVGVTSKTLGRLHIGQVVASTSLGPKGSDDYAVIRLDDVNSPVTLPLSLSHDALTPIVSAGYPGLTIQNDNGFRQLLSGDAAAAPELVLSRGEIQAVQPSATGTQVLVHSGDVMQGSSGGPIVDSCGRAIGMNTYIAVDEQQSGRVSYALAAGGLAGFLRRAGVPVAVQGSPCAD
jgi:S1-C subfamily serine protease